MAAGPGSDAHERRASRMHEIRITRQPAVDRRRSGLRGPGASSRMIPMAVSRRRWPLLLAVLALGMQLLAASGLASAAHGQCSTMAAHAVHAPDGCVSDVDAADDETTSHSGSPACTVACAVPAAPASFKFKAAAIPARAPTPAVIQLSLGFHCTDILRPPR